MGARFSPLDLAAITARWSAVWGGPWRAVPSGVMADLWDVMAGDVDAVAFDLGSEENAQAIAHAREDVPALVGEVERLRGEVVEAQRELVRLRDFKAMVVEMSRGGSVRVVDLATARAEAARRRASSPASGGGPR